MRAVLSSRCAGSFSFLSTSFCLRYGLAMPSVWLLWRACKSLRFNEVGFDYPLNFSWFVCQYLSTVEVSCARLPLQTVFGGSSPWFWSAAAKGISGCCGNDVVSRSLIGKAVAGLHVSLCLPVAPDVRFPASCCVRTTFEPVQQFSSLAQHSYAHRSHGRCRLLLHSNRHLAVLAAREVVLQTISQ
jgi:hypothetical protein